MTPEARIKRDVRLALGRYPDLTLWPNPVGVAKINNRVIKYGLCVGSSDLIGCLTVITDIGPIGRLIALEVKSPTGTLSREQRLFFALVRKRGCFACVVRSVADAEAAIARARRGAVE